MFNSPTFVALSKRNLNKKVSSYMSKDSLVWYLIIIRSDSQKTSKGSYDFIMALAIHKVGSSGVLSRETI